MVHSFRMGVAAPPHHQGHMITFHSQDSPFMSLRRMLQLQVLGTHSVCSMQDEGTGRKAKGLLSSKRMICSGSLT